MALASLDDVKRILRFTDVNETRDAQLRASLDAVESWAESRLWHLSAEGPQVETYWDVYEDATLRLPADDITVTKVTVYEYPSTFGVPLSPVDLGLGFGYDMTGDGRLTLRPTLGFSPFEGAAAQRRLRQYVRVDVHYVGTGVVPRSVTEGIAFLAAGHWQDGPRALRGMTSERIGDYSYQLGGAGGGSSDQEPSFISRAYWFLQPHLKKGRVQVT